MSFSTPPPYYEVPLDGYVDSNVCDLMWRRLIALQAWHKSANQLLELCFCFCIYSFKTIGGDREVHCTYSTFNLMQQFTAPITGWIK